MSEEEWRDIPGYLNYQASSEGRIRSKSRDVIYRDGRRYHYESRVLSQSMGKRRYLLVGIGQRVKPVHVLVCLAFHGEKPEGLCVRHGNGIPIDNRSSNLSWGTYSQNRLDQQDHGTDHKRNKTECPLGHLLVEPNLNPYLWERGLRKCRACHSGNSYVKRHPEADIRVESDRYYESYGFTPVNGNTRKVSLL